MEVLEDCFGFKVRLTDERRAHVLAHPEMLSMESRIAEVLASPDSVRLSRTDATIRLFYKYFIDTLFGGKWLCIVVKYRQDDAFLVTAYLTDKPKIGEQLWPTK